MKSIFRAYCTRLFRNIFYILGLAIAFALTYWFTQNGSGMGLLHRKITDFDYSLLASLGIPAFFSVYTPLFLSAEHKGGAFRNKLICGKTRNQIYFATLLTMILAMLIMTAVWTAGALLAASTKPAAEVIVMSIIKVLLYNTAALSYLVYIALTITNEAAVTAIEFMSFQFSFFAVMMLQMILGAVSDGAGKVIAYIINLIPIGQWLSISAIGDESTHIPGAAQLILSVIMIVLISVYGSRMFAKKDIK